MCQEQLPYCSNICLSTAVGIYDFIFTYFIMYEVLNIKYVLRMLHDETTDL